MDLDCALEAIKKVEKTLSDYAGGWWNDEAIAAIDICLRDVETALSDIAGTTAVHEATRRLREQASILYSPRKHERWGGVDKVKLLMRHDCARLRMIVKSL